MKIFATILFLVLAAQPGTADECASYGLVASIDVPADGKTVPQNVRFRVGLHPTCGGVENGPEHRFRLIDEVGIKATHKRYFWTEHFLEITPAEALKPGSWKLQVRRPLSKDRLRRWETLVTVKVRKGLDIGPPDFAGIEHAEAEAVVGTVFRSPCEAEPGWVVRTSFRLSGAEDDSSSVSELIYALDRRLDGEVKWAQFMTFRPKKRRFSFDSEKDWGKNWEYRIRVRDMAGNEITGEKTAKVTSPARPAKPVP